MKNIRSKVVRESLLDYNALAKSLQENTEGAVKNLLSETVRDTYAKLLSEDFTEDEVDDDANVNGEVEDTADAGVPDAADGGEEPVGRPSELTYGQDWATLKTEWMLMLRATLL